MKKIVALLIFISIIFPSHVFAQSTNKDYLKFNDIFYEVNFSQTINKDNLKTLIGLLQLSNVTEENELLNQSNLLFSGLALYEIKDMDFTQSIAIEMKGIFYLAKSISLEAIPPLPIIEEVAPVIDEDNITESENMDDICSNKENIDASDSSVTCSTIEENVTDEASDTVEATNNLENNEISPIDNKLVETVELEHPTKEIENTAPVIPSIKDFKKTTPTVPSAKETIMEEPENTIIRDNNISINDITNYLSDLDSLVDNPIEQSVSPVEKLIASEFIKLEESNDHSFYTIFFSIICFALLIYVIVSYKKSLKK